MILFGSFKRYRIENRLDATLSDAITDATYRIEIFYDCGGVIILSISLADAILVATGKPVMGRPLKSWLCLR